MKRVTITLNNIDLDSLTSREWDQLIRLLEKLGIKVDGVGGGELNVDLWLAFLPELVSVNKYSGTPGGQHGQD